MTANRSLWAILKRAVHAFDAAFSLARVGADDLDVQLGQRTTELGHAGVTWSVRPIDPKDGVLVRIEGYWAPEGSDVGVYRAEVAVRALAPYESKLHQSAGRIVDEDKQGAGITPALEPTMIAAVDLDQLSECLTAQSRLMEAAALSAGKP